MSSSQNGSGDSPFGVSTPPSVTSGQTPQEVRQQTNRASDFISTSASAIAEDIQASAAYSSDVQLRRRQLESAGFNPAVASIAALPRQAQVYTPVDLASRVASFNGMNTNRPDYMRGDPLYSPSQVRDLFLAQQPAVQSQIARDTANTAEDLMLRTNMEVDEVVYSVIGENTAFTYDYGASQRDIAQSLGQYHAQNVAAQASSSLDIVRMFDPDTYSRVSEDFSQRYGTIPRAELLAARGTSAAINEQFNAGMGINTQYYSREAAYQPLLAGTYAASYLEEEIPYFMGDNDPHAIFAEQGLDRGAIASVRSQLGAAGTMAGIVRETAMATGEGDAQASYRASNAFGQVMSMAAGGGGSSDGGNNNNNNLIMRQPPEEGGRPSLDLSLLQGQLDTLGSTHLQNFATALSDATNQLQLYSGGLPTAAGGGGAMATTFSDPNTFFNNMQLSMRDAFYDVMYDDQGQPIFAGMQQGQVAPLALPAPESAYDEQRNRAERNRQRREANRRAGRPEDEGVERVRAGDLFKGFVGGFLGRQSVAGDKAEVRQAAAGGGLLKMLFDKTIGVGFGVGAATDIPSAIAALPGGSLLAAPFGVLDKYGRQGAAFELPALQASMARGSGFYNAFPTSTKFYTGQIKTLSTQLGISPEAAANLLRDVGSGSRASLGVGDIKNLVIRGYDPTAVSGLIGNVQGANVGGALDVLGTMGAATSLRLDTSGNLTDVIKGSRRLSNAEVMAFTQGSADFAIGRRMSGFGGSTSATSRQALGMMRAGDTSLTANLQTMGRFQGVGVNASKGITAFATGMLDMALQAYAMDQAGGDPIAAQRILEDLSADPYAMRQALASLGISESQIDTMMLGTGGLTTRDVERSKMPPAELDLKEAKSKLGTGKTGASLRTSRALAKRSQDELEKLYAGEAGGTLADKFSTYMEQTVKFQEKVLSRIPDSKGIIKINEAVMGIYNKMNILVELEKALLGDGKILGAENPAVKRYGNTGVVKRGRGSILQGTANITTNNR